jgi:UDP-N-acetylglucosamine--N-acetylmuramyl-(pentapeptide) pyrophosphoryl-undecaprenol N-acetylglucosamine transferase
VGAAVVIRDADLTPAALAKALDDLLWDDLKRARMARASKLLGKPRAAEAVAQIALELAEGRRH